MRGGLNECAQGLHLCNAPKCTSRASHGRAGHTAAHECGSSAAAGEVPPQATPAATAFDASGSLQLAAPAPAGIPKAARITPLRKSSFMVKNSRPCKELQVSFAELPLAGVSDGSREVNAKIQGREKELNR